MKVIEVCFKGKSFLAGIEKCTVISLILKFINGQFGIRLSGSDENYSSYIWYENELKIGDELFVRIKEAEDISSPLTILTYDQVANLSMGSNKLHDEYLYFLELERILKSKGLLE